MAVFEGTGGAPVVVCLHGYCQSSAYWARTVVRVAQEGGHGLAVDVPGFGGSADLPGPYTMETFADAVATLLTPGGAATCAAGSPLSPSVGRPPAGRLSRADRPPYPQRVVAAGRGEAYPGSAG